MTRAERRRENKIWKSRFMRSYKITDKMSAKLTKL